VFFALVLIAFFGLIYSRLSLDASAFELDELHEEIAAEEERHSLLQLELARLQDPHRVSVLAESNGLVYPTARTALSVDPVDQRLTDLEARWSQAESRVRAQP
jgi:cell division protein FtsL